VLEVEDVVVGVVEVVVVVGVEVVVGVVDVEDVVDVVVGAGVELEEVAD
jgi:hypothetical protein